MSDLWAGLPVWAQGWALLATLLLPPALLALGLFRGLAPWPLCRALLARFGWANAVFVLLIAVSVGIGIGIIAQERGLRQGAARAAAKFDLVVSAPGSEVTMLLAAVYLRPADVPLVSGAVLAELAADEAVEIAAPVAFGDSHDGAPVVGTIADFVLHLSEGRLTGRVFADHGEAVAGAASGLAIGDEITPEHGVGAAADGHAHEETHFEVVGVMPVTGSPWDNAVFVPVEAVWEIHGLANGHAPEAGEALGPPFDADYVPGTPAVIVIPRTLAAAYRLMSDYTRDAETMAFLPGAVLSQLYAVLGDVRQAMSVMSLVSQVVVAVSVLLGLTMLLRLFQREMMLLRALGAPRRFVIAVVWGYAGSLLTAGSLLGLGIGWLMVGLLSEVVSRRTGIAIPASLSWSEVHLLAASISVTVLFALLPAWLASRRLDLRLLRR